MDTVFAEEKYNKLVSAHYKVPYLKLIQWSHSGL